MKIRTRNPQFTGVRAGIKFVNGVGETSDEKAAAQLKRLGYTVEQDEPEPEGDDEGRGEDPLDGMTVEQLKAHADEYGIALGDATKKDDIRAAIDAA